MQYKIGFIGVGVMSGSILRRVIENLDSLGISKSDILIYDIDKQKTSLFDVSSASSENEVFASSEIVFLGVKPQFFADILTKIKDFKIKSLVSIMAGVKIDTIAKYLPNNVGIARVMPNTPCQIGMGVSGICYKNIEKSHKTLINSIFSLCGSVLELNEQKFDAVTSISGSGPAYIYSFIKAMVNAGVDGGLSYDESMTLTIKTMEGAAKLAQNSTLDLDSLINSVCSKGGTTIEAIDYFKDKGLEGIIKGGIKACRLKSMLLSGTQPPVEIYTDGACSGNPGVGGWAAILMYNGIEKELSGNDKDTTNNKMELLSVIKGLESLNKPCKVNVYSDSAYVVNAINQNWLANWKKNNYMRGDNLDEPVKNIELWQALDKLLKMHDVTFIKVKGHSDNEYNNKCDILAKTAIKEADLQRKPETGNC